MVEQKSRGFVDVYKEPKLCAWCKNEEALPYERYEGCCSLHCRDLMECDKELAQKDKRITVLERMVEAVWKYLCYGATHHKDGCRPRNECECGLRKLREALKKLEEV